MSDPSEYIAIKGDQVAELMAENERSRAESAVHYNTACEQNETIRLLRADLKLMIEELCEETNNNLILRAALEDIMDSPFPGTESYKIARKALHPDERMKVISCTHEWRPIEGSSGWRICTVCGDKST